MEAKASSGDSEASPAVRLDEVGRDGGTQFFLTEQSGLMAARPPAATATVAGAKAEQWWGSRQRGVAMGKEGWNRVACPSDA